LPSVGLCGLFGGRLVPLSSTLAGPATTRAAAVHAADDRNRADIVDRNGRLLASNVIGPSIGADPRNVMNPEREAKLLAAAVDRSDVGRLAARLGSERHFVYVKRRATLDHVRRVRALGLPSIEFRSVENRIYPNRSLFAHTLGFVGVDNDGLSGIERAFDDDLARRGDINQPVLETSFDVRVQAIAHAALSAGVERFRAKGGSAIVMAVDTGEILAMVSLPDFDPHHPGRADEEALKDRNLTQTYELGSVFKLINAAMALEAGVVSLGDRLDASEPLRVNGHRIRDYRGRKRALSVPEAVMYSSNIASARMALMAGRSAQEAFLKRLGMDRPIQLEIGRTARPQWPRRWPDVTVANIAFGHGVAVTPLHLVRAVATLLGDGRLVVPTLLKRYPDDPFEASKPQLISAETVSDLRHLAWLVVDKGSAGQAQVPGYLIGGKTGTAEKVGADGRYQDGVVLSSFVGVLPIDQPQYVVYATLDEPVGVEPNPHLHQGGWTAAPVVGEIMARIGPILGLPPTTAEAVARFEQRFDTEEVYNPKIRRKELRVEARDARG
ncbi:MAG: peptidoglycan D,D-transpeptidase FtsI family protein, partial [Geminicoccaceae bacterium]